MATVNITLEGGAGESGTAAPESFSVCCDFCGANDELKEWTAVNGNTYHYCKVCWFDIEDSYGEIQDAIRNIVDESEETEEPSPKRQALQCNDCKKKPATEVFVHLDGRTFDLCTYCWQLADHEEDYGADFGSVPNLRKSGPVKFCECPLPCDFTVSTRCDLCSGVVIVGCF